MWKATQETLAHEIDPNRLQRSFSGAARPIVGEMPGVLSRSTSPTVAERKTRRLLQRRGGCHRPGS
jgi:hypothetical protein